VAHECGVFSLPAVLALWDAGVHVHVVNGSNKAANIKAAVDECLGCQATLKVPYVDPNYCHIRFRGYFDNVWFICDVDIVKYVCRFDERFYHFRVNKHISAFYHIGNAKDFKI